ncbi:MAG: dephospho-CoA kinase [Clostridia bacterium]|nr:dephospho-CoA kinase [Clostridia bacterium]
MKIIGLTGPTGSGKSTVAALAVRVGFAVIDCDIEARRTVEKGSDGLKAVCNAFGDDILLSDGTLNRRLLAKKAFSTSANTEKLNSTLLPFVVERINKRIAELQSEGAKTIILDAPTLYESGADRLCDGVVAVLCEDKLRRKRIIERDGLTEKEADIRLAASKPDCFYEEKTEHIIYNDGDIEKVSKEAEAIFLKLI